MMRFALAARTFLSLLTLVLTLSPLIARSEPTSGASASAVRSAKPRRLVDFRLWDAYQILAPAEKLTESKAFGVIAFVYREIDPCNSDEAQLGLCMRSDLVWISNEISATGRPVIYSLGVTEEQLVPPQLRLDGVGLANGNKFFVTAPAPLQAIGAEKIQIETGGAFGNELRVDFVNSFGAKIFFGPQLRRVFSLETNQMVQSPTSMRNSLKDGLFYLDGPGNKFYEMLRSLHAASCANLLGSPFPKTDAANQAQSPTPGGASNSVTGASSGGSLSNPPAGVGAASSAGASTTTPGVSPAPPPGNNPGGVHGSNPPSRPTLHPQQQAPFIYNPRDPMRGHQHPLGEH